jgi:bacterioferritin-associated ferredoxin
MYVCICHNITEKDIHQAVKQGVSSLKMLSESMQVSKECGCCADHAAKVLDEAMHPPKYPHINS